MLIPSPPVRLVPQCSLVSSILASGLFLSGCSENPTSNGNVFQPGVVADSGVVADAGVVADSGIVADPGVVVVGGMDAALPGGDAAVPRVDGALPFFPSDAAVVVPGSDGGASDGGTSDAATLDGGAVDAGAISSDGAVTSPDAGGDAGSSGLSPLASPLPTGKPYGEWTYVEVAGAKCRDGSPAGYYWRRGREAPLMIFMNGGGACSDSFFCGINPKNVNEDLPSESLLDATGNLLGGPDANRQLPPDEGIFKRDARNPVANWNMIYMPYCTGDIFSGSKPEATVPGVDGKQQFVGYTNVGLFLDSFGPSFAQAGKVLLTGSSAGGFGALVNYDRTQTFFNKYQARVFGVTDSGVPMRDTWLAPCLQKRWRDLWNLDAAMPKDCTGCFQADGGGLADGLGTYLFKQKYVGRKVGGMISSVEDGVIRAFYGPGLNNCTTDPGSNAILSAFELGGYSGADFRAGLKDIAAFVGPDTASYFLPGGAHMRLWRARFYQPVEGVTIAKWLSDLLAENPTHIGSP
jgi:hypothetical protein